MYWGHNIEGNGYSPYEYDDLVTQEVDWTVFHWIPLYRGDFISRNMESGRVGVYEIHSVSRMSGVSEAYNVTARFCGYLNEETGAINVFSGYGIEKPLIKVPKISYRRFVIVGLTVLSILLIALLYTLRG
jgi:hypothetical protein